MENCNYAPYANFSDGYGCGYHAYIDPDGWGWGINEYAQIIGNMRRDKLISDAKARKLSKELIEIHGVDLLKHYKETYDY